MGPSEWALLLILSVVWGGAFFFYKVLDDAGLPPFTIVFGRVAPAALVLLAVVVATGRPIPRDPRVLLAFLVLGAINNVIPFSLIVLGEKHIDSGLASIFNASTPIFAALVAPWMSRDEKLTPVRIVGAVLGLGGVALLMGPHVLRGIDLTSIAQLACVAAAVVYGFAAVYARRFGKLGIDPIVTATGQLCGSALLSLPRADLRSSVDAPRAVGADVVGVDRTSTAEHGASVRVLLPAHRDGRRDQRRIGDVSRAAERGAARHARARRTPCADDVRGYGAHLRRAGCARRQALRQSRPPPLGRDRSSENVDVSVPDVTLSLSKGERSSRGNYQTTRAITAPSC